MVYTTYMQLLTDALAVGDIDYPAYRVLREAAEKLAMLKTARTRPQPHRA